LVWISVPKLAIKVRDMGSLDFFLFITESVFTTKTVNTFSGNKHFTNATIL